MILLKNGEVYTFGSNIYGQLGVGDLMAHAGPVHVDLSCAATQVAAGNNHTVILTAKGDVYTFGAYHVGKYSIYIIVQFDRLSLYIHCSICSLTI